MLHPDDARTFYHQMIMAATLRAPTLRLVYRQRHAAGHYLWIESEIQLLYDVPENSPARCSARAMFRPASKPRLSART